MSTIKRTPFTITVDGKRLDPSGSLIQLHNWEPMAPIPRFSNPVLSRFNTPWARCTHCGCVRTGKDYGCRYRRGGLDWANVVPPCRTRAEQKAGR
jgi:hypothetical protein